MFWMAWIAPMVVARGNRSLLAKIVRLSCFRTPPLAGCFGQRVRGSASRASEGIALMIGIVAGWVSVDGKAVCGSKDDRHTRLQGGVRCSGYRHAVAGGENRLH